MTSRNRKTRCDGVQRRHFIQLGAVGGLGLPFGILPRSLQAADGIQRQKNCILIWLDGGASHLETFDPKPNMPSEVRGPMRAISTSISGIQFGECLPKLAKRMKTMTLLRSMTSPLGEHNLGTQYLLTGYKPTPAIEYPVIGCAASFLRNSSNEMPNHIAIPNHQVGGARFKANGYLPSSCLPFEISRDSREKKLGVEVLQLADGLQQIRIDRRAEFLKRLDQFSKHSDRIDSLPDYAGLDQAVHLLTSDKARAAFYLEKESPKTRQLYGESLFGQSCLMARRMIEAGVGFVTVNFPGWDTHDNLVVRLKDGYVGAKNPVGLIPTLDQGLDSLLEDLHQRGLLDETLVVVMAEFGRTPRINAAGGRDHWPRAFSVLMAGGGTPQGLVHGESDESGESPKSDAVTPADLAATIYKLLGFDPDTELHSPDGRPIRLVREGTAIKEVVG